MLNIVVMASGGGTNLQALIDAIEAGRIKNGRIAGVVSTKPEAYALVRAEKHNIPYIVFERKKYNDLSLFDRDVYNYLQSVSADLIVLAGFLTIFGELITETYRNKIINIHPALIPSFCGKGFYGLRVHQAVLDYGVKLTGSTVHFADETVDGGAIILQKAIEVLDDDTPESLQQRVMTECEQVILPQAVNLFCEDRLKIEDRRVRVLPNRLT